MPQRHVASGLDWLAIHHPARAASQHAYSHIQLFPYLPPNFYRETQHRPFSRFVPHGPSWIIRPQPEVEVVCLVAFYSHTLHCRCSRRLHQPLDERKNSVLLSYEKFPSRQSCHHVRLDSLYTLYHTINQHGCKVSTKGCDVIIRRGGRTEEDIPQTNNLPSHIIEVKMLVGEIIHPSLIPCSSLRDADSAFFSISPPLLTGFHRVSSQKLSSLLCPVYGIGSPICVPRLSVLCIGCVYMCPASECPVYRSHMWFLCLGVLCNCIGHYGHHVSHGLIYHQQIYVSCV